MLGQLWPPKWPDCIRSSALAFHTKEKSESHIIIFKLPKIDEHEHINLNQGPNDDHEEHNINILGNFNTKTLNFTQVVTFVNCHLYNAGMQTYYRETYHASNPINGYTRKYFIQPS